MGQQRNKIEKTQPPQGLPRPPQGEGKNRACQRQAEGAQSSGEEESRTRGIPGACRCG
jgi:hypothetical protein